MFEVGLDNLFLRMVDADKVAVVVMFWFIICVGGESLYTLSLVIERYKHEEGLPPLPSTLLQS